MEDLELYSSCLDYQDEDAQIIGASPITTETSESSVFPHTQSHSTSEAFSIGSSFEIVQDESYLQETQEVAKRLIFTTKQNSPKAETPSMFNDRATRATARATSLPNKRKASVPIKLWFNAHLEWPYPSQDEEISLVKNTGLTLQQVRTCFTNLRARRKAKSKL
jgi:Homeobox KN domain